MANTINYNFFPKNKEDGQISLDELLDAHVTAVKSSKTMLNGINAAAEVETGRSFCGKKASTVNNPKINQIYDALKNEFEKKASGKSQEEQAEIACRLHREFAKRVYVMSQTSKQSISAQTMLRLKFLTQEPAFFQVAFANKNNLPMTAAVNILANKKKKQIINSDLTLSQKKLVIAQITKELKNTEEQFSGVSSALQKNSSEDAVYSYFSNSDKITQLNAKDLPGTKHPNEYLTGFKNIQNIAMMNPSELLAYTERKNNPSLAQSEKTFAENKEENANVFGQSLFARNANMESMHNQNAALFRHANLQHIAEPVVQNMSMQQ